MKVFAFSTHYGSFEVHNQKPDFDLIELNQIHSADLIKLGETIRPCDGMIAPIDTVFEMGIKTADCLAILIEGASGITLLHAGWRGLAQGILQHKDLKLCEPFNAFFAPCISSKNYEVSDDFTQNFPNSDFFDRRDGRLFWCLESEAHQQLSKLFPGIVISSSGLCTFDNSQLHSYRRNKTNQRNWNIFIPKLK